MREHLAKIKKHHHISTPFTICALASLFYVYEFFLRVTPSAMVHELMAEFHMDARSFGVMSAFFYYAYTPMQIPAGLLIDRFGSRVLLSISVLICGLATLLFSATHSILLLSLSRSLIGFAAAFSYIGALVLAAHWFPRRYFALITGLTQMMGATGAILGEAPVARLVNLIGWRPTLLWSGGIGLILATCFWLVIRDKPHAHCFDADASDAHIGNEWTRLSQVCRHRQTWAVGLCGFACWAPISAFAALWGVPFLSAKLNITATAASAFTSVIWLGIALSGPLMGWWSDRVQSRRIPLLSAYIVGFLAAMAVIYWPQPKPLLLTIALFLMGAAAAAQAVTFGLVDDVHPETVKGTAVGFNNMAVIFGGVLLQPLIGWLLQRGWHGTTQHGAPVYTLDTFHHALLLVPACSLLGLVSVLFWVHETHCQPQYAAQPKQR